MNETLGRVRNIIDGADHIVAFTGAGISAESGIPTFRGQGGLWKQFRPEQLATADAFHRDPSLVWEWYDWRRQFILKAQPNPGHLALAELERRKPGLTLITQNVDGLHARAGSRRPLELHGSIWRLRCMNCGREEQDERAPLPHLPPTCDACGALLRPGVVWFGEALPRTTFDAAERASAQARVFLSIGTSAVVFPAAGLIDTARNAGAVIVEINPEATPFSDVAEYRLRGPAGEILPKLVRESD